MFVQITPSNPNISIPTGQSVTFEVEAQSLVGGSVTYEFRVNREIRTNSPSFIFAPTDSGRYRIEVIARDGQRSASHEWNVTVTTPPNESPSISFIPSVLSGEAPLTVTATVTGQDSDGTIVFTEIDFNGDGSPENSAPGNTIEAEFTYQAEGSYVARATVRDNKGATATAAMTISVLRANAAPTGTLIADQTSGDGPLTVRLDATASDPDGLVSKIEIDTDTGGGFIEMPASGSLNVEYPFREPAYRPRLRIEDNQGKVVTKEGPTITVYRSIDPSQSSAVVSGNPRFDPFPVIKPAIWADGRDALRFTITVRDASGIPVPGAPVRIASLRPDLIAPDGTNLGETLNIVLHGDRTDAIGQVSGSISTQTSSRVLAVPRLGEFVSFAVGAEVDAGHGEWRDLQLNNLTGLNAETVVSTIKSVGNIFVSPLSACKGQERQIRVRAFGKDDSPLSDSPVAGVYVDIRDNNRRVLDGLRPAPGYENWRTRQDGWIVFRVSPNEPGGWIIIAWVDGVPLNTSAILAVDNC